MITNFAFQRRIHRILINSITLFAHQPSMPLPALILTQTSLWIILTIIYLITLLRISPILKKKVIKILYVYYYYDYDYCSLHFFGGRRVGILHYRLRFRGIYCIGYRLHFIGIGLGCTV